MRLRELQRVFWQSVRTRSGPAELDQVFASRGALSAGARLEIYRTAYWVRQVQALRELFPSAVRVLGDGPFAQLASRFLGDEPSSSWALEELGPPFVAWLRAREASSLAGAIAALDWARFSVFIAPEVPRMSREALQRRGLEQLELRVGPHVASCVVPREALREGAPGLAAEGEGEVGCCAWRHGFEVLQALVSREELAALQAAREGVSFARWCELIVGSTEAGPEAVLATLERWLSRGWVVS